MQQLRYIWFIAAKDLKIFIHDRLALAFALLFPFLFVIIFNMLLGSATNNDTRLQLHLVTREQEGLSCQIISALETKDEALLLPGEPVIIWDKDYTAAYNAVENKKLAGFLAFPENFTANITQGKATQLKVITTADATYIRAALSGLAQHIVSKINSQNIILEATQELLVENPESGDWQQILSSVLTGSNAAISTESIITYHVEKIGDMEQENPSNYVIPGYLVMFVFFTAALSAESIVRERQNNTLERLLATTVKRESLLAGIYFGIAAKGLIQILIFWGVGLLVFHIDVGQSPAAIIILSLLMVVMSSAFAVMLATLVKTQRSAGSIAVLTSLVLAPLGGCWWPLFITPRWMQFLAKVTPHGWATTAFNKLMLFGGDFQSVIPEIIALACFALAFGLIAILRFRTSAA